MTERDRGRVHLNERRAVRQRYDRSEMLMGDCDLPDAPENPDFVFLFTDEQQDEIEKRFQNGITRREVKDHFVAEVARRASIACHARFNKPRRPDRKQRALKASLSDIAHATRRR